MTLDHRRWILANQLRCVGGCVCVWACGLEKKNRYDLKLQKKHPRAEFQKASKCLKISGFFTMLLSCWHRDGCTCNIMEISTAGCFGRSSRNRSSVQSPRSPIFRVRSMPPSLTLSHSSDFTSVGPRTGAWSWTMLAQSWKVLP